MDGQIINKFVDCELLSLIAVTDSLIERLWSDLFSQVTGGWIRVRGTLHPALLYPSDLYSWDLKYSLVLPHRELIQHTYGDVRRKKKLYLDDAHQELKIV